MKLKKTIIFGLGMLLSFHLAQSQEGQTTFTLEECINYAWENNLSVRSNQLNQLGNEIALKQSRFALLPSVSANGSVGKSFGRSIDPVSNSFVSQDFTTGGLSASSSVVLYSGGALRNTIKRNELNLEASGLDLEKAKNDIGLQVATNFLNVLLNQEQLQNARYQREATAAQLDRTTKLVQAGSLPITNQLDLESQLASNEVQVVNAENALNLAMLNLKQAMQMPAEVNLQLEAPTLEIESVRLAMSNPSKIYEIALDNQPDVKSAELGIQSSDMDVKISKGAFLPTLSLSGSISTNYSDQARQLTGTQEVVVPAQEIGFVQGTNESVFSNPRTQTVPVFSDSYRFTDQFNDNLGQSVRVNLSIPIFNRYGNTANLQRAEINKQRAEIQAQTVKNTLRQNIESAYNTALAALKSYEASQKRVAALEESFRATEQRYNAGSANFVDYQVANNNLFAARTDLVRAKYEYIFRAKILDFYLGNPITLD
ncbi:TolC family protein [Roseivirga sp. UBA838]|uniref:TolC family protein n=1 Tax=Roseivirga sp. UBA838 TaxID=1947393 RepID=UPI002580F967|nr:TolC family protein [Roseivirga sp. UBA838]|tara:strand:- start:95782 stop:97236 length:1455 start_codon:yes stop_codon:yes gene_type:complete